MARQMAGKGEEGGGGERGSPVVIAVGEAGGNNRERWLTLFPVRKRRRWMRELLSFAAGLAFLEDKPLHFSTTMAAQSRCCPIPLLHDFFITLFLLC